MGRKNKRKLKEKKWLGAQSHHAFQSCVTAPRQPCTIVALSWFSNQSFFVIFCQSPSLFIDFSLRCLSQVTFALKHIIRVLQSLYSNTPYRVTGKVTKGGDDEYELAIGYSLTVLFLQYMRVLCPYFLPLNLIPSARWWLICLGFPVLCRA